MRCPPRTSPTASACTPTPCACTSSACARSGSSTSRPSTAARVGRPQHLYFLAAGRAGLGFDPPAHALLAGLLAALAERVGADPEDAADVGRAWGAEVGRRTRAAQLPRGRSSRSCDRLGFEPAVGPGDGTSEGGVRIEFLHCPFRELAEAYPELVCNLHRGICEGVVERVGGGSVDEFATLYDPEPCHVTVGRLAVA